MSLFPENVKFLSTERFMEGGSSSGSGSGGGSDFECSGDEFFCDAFNDGDLSSDWNFESHLPSRQFLL